VLHGVVAVGLALRSIRHPQVGNCRGLDIAIANAKGLASLK